MDNISIIEVFISGRRIGRMALTPEGMCGFEYDADTDRFLNISILFTVEIGIDNG